MYQLYIDIDICLSYIYIYIIHISFIYYYIFTWQISGNIFMLCTGKDNMLMAKEKYSFLLGT